MSHSNTPLDGQLMPRDAHSLTESVERQQQQVDQTVERLRGQLIRRMVPSALGRQLKQFDQEQVRIALEGRNRQLAAAVDTAVKAFEHACDDLFRRGAARVDTERAQVIEGLEREVEAWAERYYGDVAERLERIEAIGHDRLRSLETQRLEREMEERVQHFGALKRRLMDRLG